MPKMARLQKQLSRKVDGKAYPKYVVTIAPKDVDKLGWKEGEELIVDIADDKAILRPLKEKRS